MVSDATKAAQGTMTGSLHTQKRKKILRMQSSLERKEKECTCFVCVLVKGRLKLVTMKVFFRQQGMNVIWKHFFFQMVFFSLLGRFNAFKVTK